MATPTVVPIMARPRRSGLAYRMRRVLKECDRVAHNFDPDAVHDLRVALRRCRSLADGVMEVDLDPEWRAMKKAGRKLFRRLGALHDVQVLNGWSQKLAPEDDSVRRNLLEVLSAREQDLKGQAAAAIESFNAKQWKRWSRVLPERARRLTPDGLVAQHVALERYQEARALHRRALRSRTRKAWHKLRIALKRFRYTVENFLARRHAAWGNDLKRLQDLLGEVHDLDTLSALLDETPSATDVADRARWQRTIERERDRRLAEYRAKMTGRKSLWHLWQAGLPTGRRLETAALAKLSATAAFLDPDSDPLTQPDGVALQLFDGLTAAGLAAAFHDLRARQVLRAAALLRNIGRRQGRRAHHKAAQRLIRKLVPPLGWTADEMRRVALVARYHRGAEPSERHKAFAALGPEERDRVRWLAGVLRLACALGDGRQNGTPPIEVRQSFDAIIIWVQGYEDTEKNAALVAGRKHLLEAVAKRPVLVRPRLAETLPVALPGEPHRESA